MNQLDQPPPHTPMLAALLVLFGGTDLYDSAQTWPASWLKLTM